MKYALNGATTMPYTLDEDIVATAKAGFTGIEIWWDKAKAYLEKNSIRSLEELLIENALEAVSLCPLLLWTFRDTDSARKDFNYAVEVAPQIGLDLIVVAPDYQPASLSVSEALKAHAEELKNLAGIARSNGIRIAIEPIGGHTLVPGPTEALHLIELAGSPDNVGILLDTFHYFRSNVTDQEILSIPAEKLFFVHVNDVEDGALNELTDAHRVYPTLGVIPLQNTIKNLNTLGYEGYYSVEIFRPEYWEESIDDIASNAYHMLDKLMKEQKMGTFNSCI